MCVFAYTHTHACVHNKHRHIPGFHASKLLGFYDCSHTVLQHLYLYQEFFIFSLLYLLICLLALRPWTLSILFFMIKVDSYWEEFIDSMFNQNTFFTQLCHLLSGKVAKALSLHFLYLKASICY